MMNIKIDKVINYTFIFTALLWPVINTLYHFDGAGLVPIVLSILSFTFNLYYGNGKIIQAPYIYWLLWVFFAGGVNVILKGFNMHAYPFIFFFQLFVQYVIMYVASLEYRRDKIVFVKYIVILLFIYLLLGVLTIDDWGGGRMLSKVGNMLPLNLSLFVFFLCLYYNFKKISLKTFLFLLMIILYVILISGTRKAFGASVIILFFFLLSKVNFRSPKTLLTFIIVFCVSFFSIEYLLDNSMIGERFSEDEGLIFVPYEVKDNWFYKAMGDRAGYYYYGLRAFKSNMLTGIGLGNYINYAGGNKHYLHSEYMVQLAECGLIGFCFFLFLLGWIMKKMIYVYLKIDNHNIFLYIGLFGAILFICFTAWIYQFPIYFLSFGVIIGYLKQQIRSYENRNLQKGRLV